MNMGTEQEEIDASLARSGALASETYSRALAGCLVSSSIQVAPFRECRLPFMMSSCTKSIASNKFLQKPVVEPTRTNIQLDPFCVSSYSNSHGQNILKWHKSVVQPERENKASTIENTQNQENMGLVKNMKEKTKHPIDVAMTHLQHSMDQISHHCKCFYDQCLKGNLTHADKRHCRMFHKGVLGRKRMKTKNRKNPPEKIDSQSEDEHYSSKALQAKATPKTTSSSSESSQAGVEDLPIDKTS